MTSFPNSPRLLKGGIVLLDPVTSRVQRIISLQYNPDSVSRTLQVKGGGSEGGDRSDSLRIKGPPSETIKIDIEIDATDQLEFADGAATQVGLHPQLAVLELIVYPTSRELQESNSLAASGSLKVFPMESPLAVFVWSSQRVVPIKLTDFSVTEEAFDASLNPIRAKVSLGMKVLSIDDLNFTHKGGSLFMSYLQNKERLAARARGGTLGSFGISGI